MPTNTSCVTLLQNQVKELTNDQSAAKNVLGKLDLIEKQLTQNRSELTKALEEHDKRRVKLEKEQADRTRADTEVTNRAVLELRQSVDSLQDVRRGLQSRINEEGRLSKIIADLEMRGLVERGLTTLHPVSGPVQQLRQPYRYRPPQALGFGAIDQPGSR